jgi:hypothetical protein
MSPRGSLALTLLMVLVAGALAGCGGGSEQVSAEELVERGDRICVEERRQFDQIQAEPLTSAAVGEQQAAQLLAVTEGAQADLRDLEPPEEIRDGYERYLDARDEVGDLLEEGREAAERRDGDVYGKAQEEAAAGAAGRQQLARQLGFTVCSQGTRTP